jgi:hypothetical protein
MSVLPKKLHLREKQRQTVNYPPYQASNANALAERWGRSVREKCLDKVIILNERHLRRVLHEYAEYYNTRRPVKVLNRTAQLVCSQLPNRARYAAGRC